MPRFHQNRKKAQLEFVEVKAGKEYLTVNTKWLRQTDWHV